MADWFDRITASYPDEHHVLASGVGELLVTIRGARIVGCRFPGVDDNLFYHPPAIETDNRGIGGGDRLWISPEVAYYWVSLEKAREDPIKWAATPAQVDPGNYELVGADDKRIHLANQVELVDVRNSGKISFLVDREVYVIEAPRNLPADVRVCSFAITNSISLEDGDEGAVAGVWSILQVPPTGTLVCPTTRRVEPTSYYDPFGGRHVPVDDRRVRFLIDGKHRIKMGIPANATTGRMGYYRPLGNGESSLIFRAFAALPGEPYVDVSRSADKETRFGEDALQAYNDDGTYGGFGEMEYHDPALVVGAAGAGVANRTGTSVTHILVGPDRAVREAGEALLAVAVEPVL